jgi:beta-galactosidase GanA
LISGEIHYPRVPEKEWERVLDATKAAGVNCIATYVFWNLHEHRRDCLDFSNGKNIARFLSLCGDRDLYVILRAGPYCCAEWNYGGLLPG